jgi:hypothetical protein
VCRFAESEYDAVSKGCQSFEPKENLEKPNLPKPTNGDKIDRIINLAKALHDDLTGVLNIRILCRISDIYATAKEIKAESEGENE